MFEVAEVGQKLDKTTFKALEPELRSRLLDLQFELQESDIALAIVLAGVEGAGKGETLHKLLEWFDPRGVEAHAIAKPTEAELEKPEFYRYWTRLPATGSVGVFLGSWYTLPIVRRTLGQIDEANFQLQLDRIEEFERMLAAERVLLVKCWMHITKKQQKRRFKELESDPDTAWRVSPHDWEYHKHYDEFVDVCTRALRTTSIGPAPWHIIEANDSRYRYATIAEKILEAARERLDDPPQPRNGATTPTPAERNVINTLDLTQSLEREDYKTQLEHWQGKLGRLARRMERAGLSIVAVFEGNDAAGKGGSIRRVTAALDARHYRVVRIAAPTDEERAHPYLWRFWRHVPRDGVVTIFDRSWYGRVLVERIEGFCGRDDWMRAYHEINEFEQQLAESKILVLKFWLSTDKDEQLARFKAREATSYKRHKITDEDWRNREKWDAYEAAVCDMVEKTSTSHAPWTLVEANDKKFARVKVVRTFAERLEQMLGPEEPPAKAKKKRKKKK